jgi:hypothetical protein
VSVSPIYIPANLAAAKANQNRYRIPVKDPQVNGKLSAKVKASFIACVFD